MISQTIAPCKYSSPPPQKKYPGHASDSSVVMSLYIDKHPGISTKLAGLFAS